MTEHMSAALRSQYRAALVMFDECVTRCPDEMWDRAKDGNRTWHLAYHTLFYTALYLSSEAKPVLWKGCRRGYQSFQAGPWAPDFDPKSATAYSKEDILSFSAWLRRRLKHCFHDADVAMDSGFSWLPMSRFEVYLYTFRHLSHHIGQLSERVKQGTKQGVAWKGMA